MTAITPKKVADAMYAADLCSRSHGMEIEEVKSDYARLTMKVGAEMLNGHASCHGGMIFTLADSAFAFASNSDNDIVVAASCSIDYLRPVQEGTRLTATCRLRSRRGRTSFYDTEIVNEDGETVALFRGTGRQIDGQVINDPEAQEEA